MNINRTQRFIWVAAFLLLLHAGSAFSQTNAKTPNANTEAADAGDPTMGGEMLEFRGRTMGTTYMVKVHGSDLNAADVRIEIDAELRRVNDQMSTYLKSSEVSQFNQSTSTEWFPVSEQTARVVLFAQQVSEKSEGAFDVTIAPLVNAWSFGPEKRTWTIPASDELERRRKQVGYEKLSARLDPPSLRKSIPELTIDLSAIAKGHGVDRVVELLLAKGAKNIFVEIGGEVRTVGRKGKDPWRVGVRYPDASSNRLVAAYPMKDRAMATSGDYQNEFVIDGVHYSHTIDPRTGRPIKHDLTSVSVVASDCMAADAWATAINVMGAERGKQLAESEGLDILLIQRTDDGLLTTGTRSLERFSTNSKTKSETEVREKNMLPLMIVTAIAFGVLLTGMAVGVIFGRKPISGSCGGIANKTNEDGSIACGLCSNPADACKELRERMQEKPQS